MPHRRARTIIARSSVLSALLMLACDGENRSASPAPAPPAADAGSTQDAGHELTPADLAKFDAVCAAAEDLWQQWLTGSCLTPQPKNADNTWTAYVDGHGHQYIYFEDSGPQCARAHAGLVAGRYGVHPDALGACEAVLTQRLARCEAPELSACSMLYGAVSVGETCYREEILGVNPCPDDAICGSCPGTCQDCEGPCYDPCALCGLGKTCRDYTIDMGVDRLTCGTGVNANCGWSDEDCDPGLRCLMPENPTNEGDPNTCRVDPMAEGGDCAAHPLDCAPDVVCKDGKCQHASLGESCVRHNQCESGNCACATGVTCKSGHCAPPIAVGQLCPLPFDDHDVDPACQPSLACGWPAADSQRQCFVPNTVPKDGACDNSLNCAVELDCDRTLHTCQPRAAEGQPCPLNVGCAPGLFCSNPDGRACDGGVEGCTCRKPGIGTRCGCPPYERCADKCDSPTVCLGGTCASPSQVGDVCDYYAGCVNPALPDLHCRLGEPKNTCQLKSAIGQSCGETNDCVAGAFCSYTCIALFGPGEPCAEGQCQEGLACTLLHDGSQRCVRRGTQEEKPWCYPGSP